MWTLYTANSDHWVPISTVASFKRMREFAPLGLEWVAKALHMSADLEVDETNTNVRRTTEIQEPKDQFERSIYAVSNHHEGPWGSNRFVHRKDSEKKSTLVSSWNWRSILISMAEQTPCA